MARQLTYKHAARVAQVHPDTVKRWRREGMPMGVDRRGRRVVDEEVLFRWKRDKIRANPVKPRVMSWRT